MLNTHQQVELINEAIAAGISTEKFPVLSINGIASMMATGEENKKIPAIRKGSDWEPMIYDDKFGIMMYHRMQNQQFALNVRDKAYGNAEGNLNKMTGMSLIIYLNDKDGVITQEQVANSIMSLFPDSVSKTSLTNGVLSVKFTILGFDFDTINIFRREIEGEQYDLANEVMLIEVKYKIECAISKSCINNCLI